MWKEAVVAQFKLLFRKITWGTEKNQRKTSVKMAGIAAEHKLEVLLSDLTRSGTECTWIAQSV
jgi:hypothetical protein